MQSPGFSGARGMPFDGRSVPYRPAVPENAPCPDWRTTIFNLRVKDLPERWGSQRDERSGGSREQQRVSPLQRYAMFRYGFGQLDAR